MKRRFEIRTAMMLLSTAVALAAGIAGCANSTRSPYSSFDSTIQRDPVLARELYARVRRLDPDEREEAERLLRECLAADLYHGPAHNNLGVILLDRGELYEAANEFEWARKLMPGHPAPRVNLAMTLERAGRFDEAISAYDAALAVFDGHLPAIEGKTRLQIRSGRIDETTLSMLDDIAMRGDTEWREWARLWKTKLEP
ncbi:MAG: hypothetical protein H6814_09100 [Phycisphaeraceae bacterium]|nr:hypothetical protein [Phycisphaeraceae bacterium]